MTVFFFFQAEDGIRDYKVTGVQTCALPIFTSSLGSCARARASRTRWYSPPESVHSQRSAKSNASHATSARSTAARSAARTPPKSERCGYRPRRTEIGRHTSELQSPCNLVCRLLLEKKKNTQHQR